MFDVHPRHISWRAASQLPASAVLHFCSASLLPRHVYPMRTGPINTGSSKTFYTPQHQHVNCWSTPAFELDAQPNTSQTGEDIIQILLGLEFTAFAPPTNLAALLTAAPH